MNERPKFREGTAELLWTEAERRMRNRVSQQHNISGPQGQFVGLTVEAAFQIASGYPMNLRRLPNGDGGIDFVVPLRFLISITGYREPRCLLHPKNKAFRCDIYVLGQYIDEDTISEFLGWEYRQKLAAAEIIDLGYGPNHAIEAGKLRKMPELFDRIMHLR